MLPLSSLLRNLLGWERAEFFIFLGSGGRPRCLAPGWPGRKKFATNCLVMRFVCCCTGRTLVSRCMCSIWAILRFPVARRRAWFWTFCSFCTLVLLIIGAQIGAAYSRVLLTMVLCVVTIVSLSCPHFDPARHFNMFTLDFAFVAAFST